MTPFRSCCLSSEHNGLGLRLDRCRRAQPPREESPTLMLTHFDSPLLPVSASNPTSQYRHSILFSSTEKEVIVLPRFLKARQQSSQPSQRAPHASPRRICWEQVLLHLEQSRLPFTSQGAFDRLFSPQPPETCAFAPLPSKHSGIGTLGIIRSTLSTFGALVRERNRSASCTRPQRLPHA